MKVAITTTGNTLESAVDERFGRAANFIVVNLDDESFVVIDNSANAEASAGAGVQAAQNIVDAGAEWILTGSMGPKAFAVIEGAGVKVGTGASGTVRDVISKFKDGAFDAIGNEQCGPSGVGKGGGGMGAGGGMGRGGGMGGGGMGRGGGRGRGGGGMGRGRR